MPSVTLRGGRVIEYDYHKVKRLEYLNLFDNASTAEQEETLVARACGLSIDEMRELSMADWRRVIHGFYQNVREADADPKKQELGETST